MVEKAPAPLMREDLYLSIDPEVAPRTDLIFRLPGKKRLEARTQLEAYLVALHHDRRIAIICAARLIRLLSAPEQLTLKETARRLFDILAIQRSRQNWGRAWTFGRIYNLLCGSGESRPIWNKDLTTWTPKKIARAGTLDMTAVKAAFEIAKMRRGK